MEMELELMQKMPNILGKRLDVVDQVCAALRATTFG